MPEQRQDSTQCARKRIRILFVGHSSNNGGAEYSFRTILQNLDRSKYEPVIILPGAGPMHDQLSESGLSTLQLTLNRWMFMKRDLWYWKNLILNTIPTIRRLRQIILEHRIDIVYTNTSAIFEAAIAAKTLGKPHIWHIREILDKNQKLAQALPLSLLKTIITLLSTKIIFVSRSAQAGFGLNALTRKKSQVIYNGLRADVSKITKDQLNQCRSELGLAEGDPTVLFVGQLIDRKNPLLLVDAAAKLSRENKCNLVFAGDGPLATAIKERASTHGIQDRCKIIPFTEQVSELYTLCDLLVLPARDEAFGLVLIEAAFFHKPSIACISQGPCEIITHEESGLLVKQDDATELASAMSNLISNPDIRQELGNNAWKRQQLLFSAEKTIANIQQTIDQCTLRHRL